MQLAEPVALIGREYQDAFFRCVESADERIDLLFYFWHMRSEARSDPIVRVRGAMGDAVARGVQVRVLTPSAAIAAQLRRDGLNAKQMHTGKTMHVKLALFDGMTAIVGSHNMTRNAMQENWELSLLVRFPNAQNRIAVLFENLWAL
jgi:phosphatidylserine/phosphatidylglycerophosphate/cardiolipin synthase-like enzyme